MTRRMISALRSRCCMQLAGLLVLALWGNAQADTLLLHNGDRLTGTLISIADEKVDFETVYAGVLKVEKRVVSQIETSRNYIFRGAAFEQRGQLLVIDGQQSVGQPDDFSPLDLAGWFTTQLQSCPENMPRPSIAASDLRMTSPRRRETAPVAAAASAATTASQQRRKNSLWSGCI